MPERCVRRCSIVTRSSIRGRSAPSTSRTGWSRPRAPSATRLSTVRAVSPLVPLAVPSRVEVVMGTPWRRSARPKAASSTVEPSLSTRTTPENPVEPATASTVLARVGVLMSSMAPNLAPGRPDGAHPLRLGWKPTPPGTVVPTPAVTAATPSTSGHHDPHRGDRHHGSPDKECPVSDNDVAPLETAFGVDHHVSRAEVPERPAQDGGPDMVQLLNPEGERVAHPEHDA